MTLSHFALIGFVMTFSALPFMAKAAENKVTTFQLENEMQVVVVEDHRAPVVQHMVWYRAGSADEPKGSSGVPFS